MTASTPSDDGDQAPAGVGTESRPLRVAIVGSGPSGFYAADHLLKAEVPTEAHVFERLPTPYGLVRHGVAPDHAKIRNVIKQYEKTAQRDGFRFWGNVTVGRDVTVDELRRHFDAVIFAFGAETDRKLKIPGEDLPRSYTATAFCAWYNGHPDYRDAQFDLSHEEVAVIGQGNVAMDVTRMLAKSPEELRETDIASHAYETLAESSVKRIHVIGRRGPAQAKFTPKEVKELGAIDGCDIIVNPEDLQLSEADEKELDLEGHESNKRNMPILHEFAERERTGAEKQIHLHFFKSPERLLGEDSVEGLVLRVNELTGEPGRQKPQPTDQTDTLDCQVLFRSIGYHGVPIEGIPFDEKGGVIPNEQGRVELGLYATGWIKRGPSGLIGTNKKDSEETVEQLMADLPNLPGAEQPADEPLAETLSDRGVRVVSYEDWQKIDAAEIERGKAQGKPRDNFTRVDQMLAVLDEEPEAAERR